MSIPRPISRAKNPDLRNSMVALECAAKMARETATRTNTDLIVAIDGKITRIPPDVLRAEVEAEKAK